jgi:hypothetical protein
LLVVGQAALGVESLLRPRKRPFWLAGINEFRSSSDARDSIGSAAIYAVRSIIIEHPLRRRPTCTACLTTNNQLPTTNNQQPTTNNQQPTTNNQQPTTNNQQPQSHRQTTR